MIGNLAGFFGILGSKIRYLFKKLLCSDDPSQRFPSPTGIVLFGSEENIAACLEYEGP